MKTNITPKQLFLNCFRANARQIHRAGLALTLCLFGFLLSARGQDPWIINTNYPMDANLSVGAIVTFRAYAATTNGPITYQWQHEGTNLPSATNVTLVITNITVADAGGYRATVWNVSGDSTNTRTATLTVDPTFIQAKRDRLGDDGFLKTGPDYNQPQWLDYNGDGWLDVLLRRGRSGAVLKNELYRNNSDGTFTRVTNALTQVAGNWASVVCADFDGDGYIDVFMSEVPPRTASLFLNQRSAGTQDFKAVKLPSPAGDYAFSSCADYDNDGWTDLFVGGYSAKSLLFRNQGGRFQLVTNTPLTQKVEHMEWQNWVDYDEDGDVDLFTAASGGPQHNPLFQNQGDGHFLRITNHVLVNSLIGNIMAGWGDYDNDGLLDVFLPSADSPPSLLYRNLGGGLFEPDPAAPSLDNSKFPLAPTWVDYDNDGDLDLFVTFDTARSRLFNNDGTGKLTEVWVGSPTGAAGNAYLGQWGDYNNDGFPDLLLGTFASQHFLFLNNLPQAGNQNHWLKVQLKGRASNPNGLGAKVRVKATIGGKKVWQMRQLGILPLATELLAHFGLGDATNVDLLRIEWPSGNVQELTDVAPDRLLTLTEPTVITPIRPSASLNGSVTLTRMAVAGATYQWQFNGVYLAGQTNRTLNLTNIVADQQGHYSVVASNATTITTNFVYLQVDTTFSKITQGPAVTDRGNSLESGSWGDYDGDGYPDLYVARYNVGHSALYHNERDGTFTSITNVPFAKTGVAASGAWADFDNDGRQDLFMAPVSGDSFCYFNNGDGTFSTNRSQYVNAFSLAAADYNRDGFMDLFIPSYYSVPGTLCRNNGDRTFTRMTSKEAGALVTTQTWGGAAWADYDDDGWLDLYTANYSSGQPLIFHNDGEGRFVLANNLVTRSRGAAIAGAWGDYDNDGKLDLCVACLGGIGSVVYRNLGNGEFEKAAIGSALGSANSAVWVDYDNDGFLDLFFTSQNSLYRNNGDGTFTRVTTGSVANDIPVANAYSYSGLWFDYDNDGFLDLYVFNGSEAGASSNFLYHNNGNNNAWLKVRLIGTASNRDGVGAKVRALATYASKPRWQRRDITAGDGQNGNQLYAHFGLGNATKVTTLSIEWPSGKVQEFANVATNQFLTLWEPPTIFATVREDGACALSITAEPNRGWQIQASSDLLTWQTLTTLTNTTATFQFTDTAAVGMNSRFYRVVSE